MDEHLDEYAAADEALTRLTELVGREGDTVTVRAEDLRLVLGLLDAANEELATEHMIREADRACRVCGCTELSAFETPDGDPCCWMDDDLCSACHDYLLIPFQERVQPWMMACFGAEISADREERNHRFLEESLELVQACGATADECHQLVAYVYGRPQGEVNQEVGGVMVTLAAHCLANGVDMHAAGDAELARIWTEIEAIRAKQAAKPKHSPLPGPTPESTT